MSRARIEYWKGDDAQWYWLLKAENGKPMCYGGGKSTRAKAKNAARDTMDLIRRIHGEYPMALVPRVEKGRGSTVKREIEKANAERFHRINENLGKASPLNELAKLEERIAKRKGKKKTNPLGEFKGDFIGDHTQTGGQE